MDSRPRITRSTTPALCRVLSVKAKARAVESGNFALSSENRTRPELSASATGIDHFFNPTSSNSSDRRTVMSRTHQGPSFVPPVVRRYSGRMGCPCPGFRRTQPCSVRAMSVCRSESRLRPRRRTRVTNFAPFERWSSAKMGTAQRWWNKTTSRVDFLCCTRTFYLDRKIYQV